ncbi:MAG: hypothetical protein ACYCVD_15935 [Desulfitobacteriaceae bacterium]
MKKIYTVILCTFLISTLFPRISLAADPLYKITHAREINDYQSALIVGQLSEKVEGKFKVKVLKVISGPLTSEEIYVPDTIKYGWREAIEPVPMVDDYCVMSLMKTENLNVYNGASDIFKADSGDYKDLKILVSEMKYPRGTRAEIAALQWFVNSNGTENNFMFKSDEIGSSVVSVERLNGEIVQIYPEPNKTRDWIRMVSGNHHLLYFLLLVVISIVLIALLRKRRS